MNKRRNGFLVVDKKYAKRFYPEFFLPNAFCNDKNRLAHDAFSNLEDQPMNFEKSLNGNGWCGICKTVRGYIAVFCDRPIYSADEFYILKL